MNNIVTRDECLYRAVKRSQPSTIDSTGRPTSALFKQDNGVSVDRGGQRDEQLIIDTVKANFQKRFKGLVSVGADICIDNSMAVIPAPSSSNIYHAEIFENEQKSPLSQLKALILADSAKVVVLDNSVEWVSI